MRINRRKALALFGLGAGAAAGPALADNRVVSFRHGVASGDPLSDRVILWTRITPTDAADAPVAYSWTLTPVEAGRGKAKSGKGTTDSSRDYTVKVDVTGLAANCAYKFQFSANGVKSPVGQTRTLPVGAVDEVVLAVATCALYTNGYFNAYQAIADMDRVDAVLHLGDYIYEYAPEQYGYENGSKIGRLPEPPREIVTLNDYRIRHACYKSDPQLQAAHARAPWIVVWDDHETANDSWKDGAENHQPALEGDWNQRKAVAIKAYYEWMPIREPRDGGFAINRTFEFGNLLTLFMLETRLTARDHQLNYEKDLNGADGKPDVAAFRKRLNDPARQMMGASQADWLAKGLKASVKAGQTWQVLGNEVVMARLGVPDIRANVSPEILDAALAKLPASGSARIDRMARMTPLGLPYGLDMWDGYPAERQRLYASFEAAKANVVVLSGDSHAFWANELYDAPEGGKLAAVEFGSTGITSPGAGDALPGIPVGEVFAKANREVIYSDQAAKGFIRLTLTHTALRADMVAVSTILEKTFTTQVLKSFTATPGKDGVSRLKAL